MNRSFVVPRTVIRVVANTAFTALLGLFVAPAWSATTTLTFSKTPDGQTINLGDTATFHYVITNTGQATAMFPQLGDPLPDLPGLVWQTTSYGCNIFATPTPQFLECDFDALPPGEQVTAEAFAVPTTCGVLSSTATVTTDNVAGQLHDPGQIIVSCACQTANPLLGAANNCTVLQRGSATLGQYKVDMSGPPTLGGIVGNMCVGPKSALSASGSTFISGSILLDAGATCTSSNAAIACPPNPPPTDLSAEIGACGTASANAAALACTLGDYTKSLADLAGASGTITQAAGQAVVCVKEVVLNGGKVINLNGTDPTSSFVINSKGAFAVNGNSKIKGTGTVGPSKILYNVIGTGTSVGLTGSSEIDGTLTALARDIGCDPCKINGQVCGGRKIAFSSGASVQCAP